MGVGHISRQKLQYGGRNAGEADGTHLSVSTGATAQTSSVGGQSGRGVWAGRLAEARERPGIP